MAMSGKGTALIDDVGTSDFLTVPIRKGASRLWAGFTNSADKLLDAFQVQVQAGDSDTAPWATIANAASDYTTSVQWPIMGCDVDLTTLAKSSSGTIALEVRGLQNVRFKASAGASSDTTLSYFWSVS
ncbi:MAG TPA: hypothetical protein VMY35_10650 [Phycisphaerae bacterium]|nr:hypothetical protein [Phycisphaerae bacterium]